MLKKTILITGVAGFIGSHLARKYLREGYRVIGVDNLQTTGDTKHIQECIVDPKFTFYRHDIVKPFRIKEQVDWIFNLACAGSYTSYQWNPVHTMQTNTVGMINMLELALQKGARILQTSTSEIYGDPLEFPQKETYRGNVNTLGPRACYDEGKRSAETLCMDYHREYGVDVKIVRIFNTYGPSMDPNDGRAVTNFILHALDNRDIVIYGDGSNTRSFQYIDDLVDGIDRMMRKENFTGPVNLGNPGELTMKEFAEKIIALTGSSSKIVYDKDATDDPKRRCPDITLAKKKLDWQPNVAVDEGLLRTIEYFKAVERPNRKVLVFATTYAPHMGPAEEALHGLTQAMPETEFHIVTTRFSRNVKKHEVLGNVTLYRVGTGSVLDKYALPLLGLYRAHQLGTQHNHVFVWSVMASYAGLAGLLYRVTHPRVLHFVTLDDRELMEKRSLHQRLLARIILRGVEGAYVSKLSHTHNSPLLQNLHTANARGGDAHSFARRVQMTYAEALNKRDKKLPRAK
jgi:UDP-glucuronate decarboxylase